MYDWIDEDLILRLVDALEDSPGIGRPTLSKVLGLSMYKTEQLLKLVRDNDLEQRFIGRADAVERFTEALLGTASDDEEESWSEADFDSTRPVVYDSKADVYHTIIRIQGKTKTVSVPGDTHRAMRQAYSSWDGNSTINTVSKKFGVSRNWFTAYKNAHGWTHDIDPFTDEEIESNDVEELSQRALQRKRYQLEKRVTAKWEQEQSRLERRDAEKWRAFEEFGLKPILEAVETYAKAPKTVPKLTIERSPARRHAVVMSLQDLHYGKYAWEDETGNTYSRDIARKRLLETTTRQLEELSTFGTPEKVFLPIGPDFFHVDGFHMGTTRGTLQDVDGSYQQLIWEGVQLAEAQVNLVRQFAPEVELVIIPGNHDEQSRLSLHLYLLGMFKDLDDVIVTPDFKYRQYRGYGHNALGFEHGDGVKYNMLNEVFINEADHLLSGTKGRRYFFTGHLHHEEVKDKYGIVRYQCASLSSADRWHVKNGYVGSRQGLNSYVIDYHHGCTWTGFHPIGASL